jgi:hypothetical protein
MRAAWTFRYEGPDDVVVRAALQAGDHVTAVGAGGHDDHGYVAGRAYPAADAQRCIRRMAGFTVSDNATIAIRTIISRSGAPAGADMRIRFAAKVMPTCNAATWPIDRVPGSDLSLEC